MASRKLSCSEVKRCNHCRWATPLQVPLTLFRKTSEEVGVPRAYHLGFPTSVELLTAVFAQRLEHSIAHGCAARAGGDQNHRPVGQTCQHVYNVRAIHAIIGHHRPSSLDVPAARKDRQLIEQPPL